MSGSWVTMRMVVSHLPVDGSEEVEDLGGGGVVEFACGFVGEQERGLVGEGDRYGDALLLAAGQLFGGVVQPVSEANQIEKFPGALSSLPAGRVWSASWAGQRFPGW